MTPTEILRREHDLILRVLEAAETEVRSIEKNHTLNANAVDKLLDFFRNFADRCHHGKEEQQLFQRMQLRGMPVEGGPIGVMLYEHDAGRNYLRAVAEALAAARIGHAASIEAVRNNLAGYIQLLRSHIHKENNILFPMADRLLAPEDQADVLAGFEKVEAEEMGEGTHERYHQLAHELIAA